MAEATRPRFYKLFACNGQDKSDPRVVGFALLKIQRLDPIVKRLPVTVDSATFRGQTIPLFTNDVNQMMTINPELNYSSLRRLPRESHWEIGG
jgi:hypothetical protein